MKLKSPIKERINEISIMRRSFHKLKESSGLGANFDKAQRAYDAQTPDDDDDDEPPLECPECGGDGEIIKSSGGRRSRYWSYEARCSQCGHKWGDDNLP